MNRKLAEVGEMQAGLEKQAEQERRADKWRKRRKEQVESESE